MEKHILRTRFTRQKLNIVYDENIDKLVEVNEIISVVFLYGIDVLLGKFFSRNIEDSFFRIICFDLNTMA